MKDKCLIVSLKYHAGHWSHIVATYSLFNELGYDTYLHVNREFVSSKVGDEFRICNNLTLSDYKRYKTVIVLFPNVKNTWEICKLKIFGNVKILYLFHEPVDNYISFYRSGFTLLQLIKLFFINQFNKFTAYISTIILLPSNTSFLTYSRDYKYLNRNFYLVPLLFVDEFITSDNYISEKKYISYIGTIANDHAFTKFCKFVIYAIEKKMFQDKIFLIATSSKLNDNIKNELLNLGSNLNLKIIEGNWLTNQEINGFFKTSIVVWNAYDRSTQSGVLPKAFMFSTPVLANSLIHNEYVVQNHNGIYLKDNSDISEISLSVQNIIDNIANYSNNSRITFLNKFYYKNYISEFTKILNNG